MIGAAPAIGRRVRVAGAGRSAAYGEDGGFVVVFTREPPVLPNGVQVARLPAVGDEVVVRADRVWDPTLRLDDPPAVAVPDDDLARALLDRDVEAARAIGARSIGRGPGLTPEGDDLVAGVAAVVAAGSWPRTSREAWVGALIGGDLRRRTTSLSATLLELAALGMGPEPLQAWLAGDVSAGERLVRLGHSTGRAIARGAAIGLSCNRRVASRRQMCHPTVTRPREVIFMQIERETMIAAPVERVWAVLTEAEHVGQWFSDAGAEIDLRPGGAMVMRWTEYGTIRARVVDLDPPRRFTYRWVPIPEHWGEEPDERNSTLVEFTLAADGDGTRLRVVESGFEAVEGTDEQRRSSFDDNTEGWEAKLGEVREYAERVAV